MTSGEFNRGTRSPGSSQWRVRCGRPALASRSFRLPAILAVLVAVVGLLPATGLPAAAQTQSGAEEQQGQAAPGGGFIEIHLVECPPDFQGESGNAYYDACHTNPIEDVTVNLTSTGTDTPFEASAVTEQVEANGHGLVTFDELAAGDYEVTIDFPEADVADVFSYCSVADGDDEIPVSPDDALTGTLALAEGQGMICDWYITPGADAPQTTIDLFAFVCDPDALPSTDDPAYEDFAEACTERAPETAFHLLDDAAGTDTVETTDADGRANFVLDPATDYRFYAEVPLEADEYLWCAVDNGEAQAKTFDDRGVTTFESGEPQALTCSWFLIEATGDATAQATTDPTSEPTTEPVETTEATTAVEPAAAPTEVAEATTEDASEQDAQDGPDEGDLGQIVVSVSACPQEYDPETQGVDFESLNANCTDPLDDVSVSFTMTGPDGVTEERVPDGEGDLQYLDLEPGTYTLFSSVPLEAAREYLFCTADGGNRYEKEFNDRGVTTFEGLQREQIECEWFVVPLDLRGEESGGSLEVHLAACPVDYDSNTLFDDCHGNGVADQEFQLSGPDGELSGTTVMEQTPGPGIVTFTDLPAGEYTMQGGPPGDFGRVELYCSVQPGNAPVDTEVDSTTATFTIAENQDVLCDWYYIPEDSSGLVTPTPSPTPEPTRAEILVTLFACPAPEGDAEGYGGATFEQLSTTCTEPVNDVPFTLGDVGAAPLRASTGVSGEGAVRFFDLLQADYTLTPSLPSNLSSTAVFCTVGEGDPYQKALENGATRFNDIDGESIACSWFAVEAPETEPAGPTGSITIREYLCEDDREEIEDWDTECAPGQSGSSFTLTASEGDLTREGTPNASGVHVFSGLEDGFYELRQNDGMWCRAVADRVDRNSRVIVQDGGNTDVVLYHCSAVAGLPDTGTGPGGTVAPSEDDGMPTAAVAAGIAGLIATPLVISVLLKSRTRRRVTVSEAAETSSGPVVTASGKVWMRFK